MEPPYLIEHPDQSGLSGATITKNVADDSVRDEAGTEEPAFGDTESR